MSSVLSVGVLSCLSNSNGVETSKLMLIQKLQLRLAFKVFSNNGLLSRSNVQSSLHSVIKWLCYRLIINRPTQSLLRTNINARTMLTTSCSSSQTGQSGNSVSKLTDIVLVYRYKCTRPVALKCVVRRSETPVLINILTVGTVVTMLTVNELQFQSLR